MDFVFLNLRGILNCHSSIPRGIKFSEELPSLLLINYNTMYATLETALTHFVLACKLIQFLCSPKSVKK